MLLEVNLVSRMETTTIEQIHRLKQLQLNNVDRLPAINKLSREQGFAKPCAFKEYRFEPPYVSKRKERKRKKLPPIPELMMPKRHNSFDEELEEDLDIVSDIPTLPSLSISPAFITEKVDERSLSVEAATKSPHNHMFNTREFTFPESHGAYRKRPQHSLLQPIVPALTPRDIPLQAKIEKLAKQKRRERAKRLIERRYERKHQNLAEMQSPTAYMAFRPRREPEVTSSFHLKEHKQTPFKQMVPKTEEAPSEKPRFHPRLYNRIVDGIYTYTKGLHDSPRQAEHPGPYERLMVTPVTAKEEVKEEAQRQIYLPPIVSD
ncbi:uncharacterized protein LOC128235046 [Mya arenaria]|uniref:uncharacterized protein LOC128235046 n=1 Tax=Mya arenaria TaxID=6604 RepID=UPI0022E0D72D|nr:uncharacterized protein LOC128235046 [Mya arenaria]